MRRPKLAAILILAILNLLLAPVRTSWACPDGTACVQERGHGFVCPAGQCAVHGSCCEAKKQVRCKHGSFPVVHHSASTVPTLDEADHCRFTVQGKPQLTAQVKQAGPLWVAFDLLPPPALLQIILPCAPSTQTVAYAASHSPPPLLPSGPSRAPPTL